MKTIIHIHLNIQDGIDRSAHRDRRGTVHGCGDRGRMIRPCQNSHHHRRRSQGHSCCCSRRSIANRHLSFSLLPCIYLPCCSAALVTLVVFLVVVLGGALGVAAVLGVVVVRVVVVGLVF